MPENFLSLDNYYLQVVVVDETIAAGSVNKQLTEAADVVVASADVVAVRRKDSKFSKRRSDKVSRIN